MRKLLILDDEKNIRISVKRCLESDDLSIDDAVNGEEALLKLQGETYNLLLLDLKLPGMDGMEVLQVVRELYPQMKVVIISAHGSIQTAVSALKAGATDFLEKPFTPSEIRTLVERVLEQ